jgi:hypothetical protein
MSPRASRSPRQVIWLVTKLLIASALVYTLAMGAFLLFVSVETSPSRWPNDNFSKEAWSQSVPSERYRFVQDLLARNDLDGKNRKQVLDLLGEPDSQWPGGQRYSYILRNRDEGRWDFNSVYFLSVTFDSKGLVVSAEIEAD